MPTLYPGEWKRFVDTKGRKKIDQLPNSCVRLSYYAHTVLNLLISII